MTVLAIETATSVCAAAVVRDGVVLAEQSINKPHIHAEKLLTMVDNVFSFSQTSVEAIQSIAVSIGPGSFTGLRIGLSTAKGLSYALDKPIIAVPTLEALAQNCIRQSLVSEGDWIVSMIDAKRSEFYVECYQVHGQAAEEVIPMQIADKEHIKSFFPRGQRAVLVGDGAEAFFEWTKSNDRNEIISLTLAAEPQRIASASSVGIIGEKKMCRGEFANTSTLEPLYLREFITTSKPQHVPEN